MAAERSESASDTTVKPFPYQVAGHLVQDGFKMTVDDCVLKPVQRPPKGEREVIFYETVFDEAEERNEILQLRRFLPHYYGVVELDMTRYLKLENITGRFNVPCIMDIKIGKVTWDDDVDDKFKEERRKKWPLKEITGFSILGFMVYNHRRSCYERYNREWCLKLATLEDAEKGKVQMILKN
ncbi:inositol polyphosphate multikinase-like isoform X1 [Orbicella faveolata]|uniref:inositol polyphosphate multikinase-like isoform X1 n=2 Tax=Orbicella faveolata TaxID=48498 RepID=UPI0009E35873|nr:inositol polyphosphate multikinase-like isoform X1 [Orbicella faveolata]